MIELNEFLKQLVQAANEAQLHISDLLIKKVLDCFEVEERDDQQVLVPKSNKLAMPAEVVGLMEAPARLSRLVPVERLKYSLRTGMVLKDGKLYIDLKDGLLKKRTHVDIELELSAKELPEIIEQLKDYMTDNFHQQTGEGGK